MRALRPRLFYIAALLLLSYALLMMFMLHARHKVPAAQPAREHAGRSFEDLAAQLRDHHVVELSRSPEPTTAAPVPATSLPKSKPKPVRTPAPPVPTTAPQVKVVPVTPQPSTQRFKGVDLAERDNAVRPNPGGTEAQALAVRRKLSGLNRKATSWHEFRWHDGPKLRAPPELLPAQTVLGDSVRLPFELALETCGGPDFACIIRAYPDESSTACRRVYGADYIKRLQNGEVSMCAGGTSELSCRMTRAHESHEIDTAACRARNVAVNFAAIGDGDYPWLAFERGALQADCHKTAAGGSHWHFMHCQADWMNLGFAEGSKASGCKHRIKGPVYIETRSGDYSPFAVTHDWLNTVISHAAFGLSANDVRTLIMDRMTVGFYTPVWEFAFSKRDTLLWYTDLREEYAGATLCFDEVYFNIPARLSPLYNHDDCEGSAVMEAYRDFVLHTFDALRTVSRREWLTVSIIVRRNYNTGHQIGRRFGNLKALTSALRGLADDVVVNQVDFADMDFDHQMNVSRSSDVLVAIHGAGLIHLMFQHSFAGVFEFFCPEKPSANYRYAQLSKRMRRTYDAFTIDNDENVVDIATALPKLKQLVDTVRRDKARFFEQHPSV